MSARGGISGVADAARDTRITRKQRRYSTRIAHPAITAYPLP